MGNLLLTRKHYLPISFAFDLARLGFEAWMVIGLRTAKLAMGGPAAMLEAQRMVAEKTAAMLEGQAAAGVAGAAGSSKAAGAPKAIAPYRRRVKGPLARIESREDGAPAPPGSGAGANPWVIAAIVVIPTFMEVLDTTITVVALRYIAGGLSATVDDGEWVITSYLAANAIILPITGWLSAHLGRRN